MPSFTFCRPSTTMPLAGLQPLRDHHERPGLRAGLHGPDRDLVVRPDHGNLEVTLQFVNRPLGDYHRARDGLHDCADLGILARPEHVPGIREKDRKLERSGHGVHLPVGKSELALLRIDAPVGKDQLDLPFRLACCRPARLGMNEFLLADRHPDLDGIDGRDVVSSSDVPGPTRFPICALAIPAMPLMGEVIRVNPRSSCVLSRAAFAAS